MSQVRTRILVFCLAVFGVLAVCSALPVMAVDGDMEGGRWELVGANGSLSGAFRNGLAERFPPRPSGRLTMWHANGGKSGEAEFHNGIPEGKFRGWYEHGELGVEGLVVDCKVVTATLWDKSGRRRFVASEDSLTAYDESGARTSYTIDQMLDIIGRSVFYFWLMSGIHWCSGS